MKRTTEQDSNHNDLDLMSTGELLQSINQEDQSVPLAISKSLDTIETVIEAVYERLNNGGRLFYIGAGTSGRLGIVDASECPPTFGVPHGKVVGLIAGGDEAIRMAVENAEDDLEQAWIDLKAYDITEKDFVIGIAASGSTPYVIGGLQTAQKHGIGTGCIVCNSNSNVAAACEMPIEIIVGPEFVTGSTRMKSGTAQKLVLNMISTAVMIKLGHVKGNKMVDMQLSNDKLVDRGTRMIMDQVDISYEEANKLLKTHGSVRLAVDSTKK